MSQVEKRPITPPRYLKDPLEINDIEGSRPKKHKVIEFETRDTMKIDDIEGTKAKWKHSPR